jgi:hypothetical protein
MKTLIIAAILSVGILLRPQVAPMENSGEVNPKATNSVVVSNQKIIASVLEKSEMQSLRGAGILECYSWVDLQGDKHGMCCVNLWLFRLCGDVNVSEVERLISSII